MKGFQILLGCIVVAVVCLYVGLPYLAKQEEMDVATGVAETFLQSAINEDSDSVVALASRGYQERIGKIEHKKPHLIPERLIS
jgi:hypothetical protein